MPVATNFENFQAELCRLIEIFGKNLKDLKNPGYDELKLRMDFLDPFFKSLGWDVENRAGHITAHREVEVESRTKIEGGHKRADYLFRADGKDRFICEAKKPAEELHAAYAFQAKRYAYNKNVYLALLTDFEELKLYIVGGKPHLDRPEVGLWKEYRFQDYSARAKELWDLLAYENIATGSIEKAIESLPRKATGTGKARQQWLIKPDRSRSLDNDFLNFLDEARRSLASDLIHHNDRDTLLTDDKLNIATQHILDRLLFLRICEDRDIDTGVRLDSIADTWRKNYGKEAGLREKQQDFMVREEPPADSFGRIHAPKDSLWHAVVRHFRALDRRPPSHVPFFNGNLFKKHFSEDLLVSDEWLADFIRELSTDESPYLFNVISVEILGTIYERFLGKIVRPQGRGVTIEEKPEVRKAGGVYYTPSYIVDYIVEQTVGKLVDDKMPADTLKLTVLDPACGSGSFLIRAYERLCEHWQRYLTADFRKVLECASPLALSTPTAEKRQRTAALQDAVANSDSKALRSTWEKKHRKHCWVDALTGDVHLTVSLKREILTHNIYGVDLDAAAVEVTQLSLYLKMLENENRNTLARERELFAEEIALLPPLQDNIKNGNSLIASDFGDGDLFSEESVEQLTRIKAFDWNAGFPKIMKGGSGGFDAVVGNPPYIRIQTLQETDPLAVEYLNRTYKAAAKGNYDLYVVFVERALSLLNQSGLFGYIIPHKFFNAQYGEALRTHLSGGKHINKIVHFGDQQIFDGATTYTCLLFLRKVPSAKFEIIQVIDLEAWKETGMCNSGFISASAISGSEWNFQIGAAAQLLEKLGVFPTRLGDIADRMAQGIRTSANEVYVMDVTRDGQRVITAQSEILGKEVKIEKDLTSRFLQGRDIKRYVLLNSEKSVLIPYRIGEHKLELISEKELRENFPHTHAYLKENKSYLESRERGRMRGANWYGYVYPKNIDVMQKPKILVPDIADRASFALDESGEYAFTSGYGITLKENVNVSPKFILGLLNSPLLDFFLKRISTTMRGGFFRYFTQFIEKLPIVLPDLSSKSDRARHDKLVALVDKMLVLTPKLRAAKTDSERHTLQNAVSATDHQIDQLVYELYGLTEEEIALVEGK